MNEQERDIADKMRGESGEVVIGIEIPTSIDTTDQSLIENASPICERADAIPACRDSASATVFLSLPIALLTLIPLWFADIRELTLLPDLLHSGAQTVGKPVKIPSQCRIARITYWSRSSPQRFGERMLSRDWHTTPGTRSNRMSANTVTDTPSPTVEIMARMGPAYTSKMPMNEQKIHDSADVK